MKIHKTCSDVYTHTCLSALSRKRFITAVNTLIASVILLTGCRDMSPFFQLS